MSSVTRMAEQVEVIRQGTRGEGDAVAELLETPLHEFRTWLDDLGIDGEIAKAELFYAYGFLHGMANERGLSVSDLLNEEGM